MLSNGVGSLVALAVYASSLTVVSATPLASPWSHLAQSSSLQKRTSYLQLENNLAWIRKWAAVGDSYASGIGAGSRIDYKCSRYDQAYPNVIRSNELLPKDQEFEFKACSGAKSDEVVKQIESLKNDLDVITISSGGNDVNLVELLNECVFTWRVKRGCEAAMTEAKNNIKNALPGHLDNLYAAAKKKLAYDGFAYITAYARFFDETSTDCDKVSWHWYPYPAGVMNYQYLTIQRRKDLNELVDMVNNEIKIAVEKMGDRFVLVSYDSTFGRLQGRYCLPGVKEPAPNRPDLLFYQDGTKEGVERATKRQDNEPKDDFPPNTFEGEIEELMKEGEDNATLTKGNGQRSELDRRLSFPKPDSWAQVFHPTQLGHSVIAGKVLYHMSVTGAQRQGHRTGQEAVEIKADVCPNTGSAQPIPRNQEPACGKDLGWNFPREFQLTDGRVPLSGLLFKMREQICKGTCDKLPGVPDEVLSAQRQGETGCEYAVKLSENKEAYFYATGSGRNCYDASEVMINGCMALKKDAKTINEAGWVNGPNFGEFYQVGVRDLNGAGSHHPPLTTDSTKHLPHLHVTCARNPSDGFGNEQYHLVLSGWHEENDGGWGKPLQKSLKRCFTVNDWSYYNTNQFQFHDRTRSEHKAMWTFPSYKQHCAEDKIADALGLPGYKLECSPGMATELDVFS